MNRRSFLKATGGAAIIAAVGVIAGKLRLPLLPDYSKKKSAVYFTDDISADGLLKLYGEINGNINGKVAIKWHSGEPHGPNIIPRDMVMALQQSIPNSALVETNTLYAGARFTTERHRETLKINGWDFCPVDIMDEDGAIMLPIRGGRHFKEMSIGKNMTNYDSMVVLTHFKGHASGGFGGSLKNIAIGCADGPVGKKMIHEAPNNYEFGKWRKGARFMENMAEAGKAVADFFGEKIVYINVLRNMSADCDCTGIGAAPVKARDIGILASTDILAIDKASVDLAYQLPEDELRDLRMRIESREGLRQLEYMEIMGMGNGNYELVKIS